MLCFLLSTLTPTACWSKSTTPWPAENLPSAHCRRSRCSHLTLGIAYVFQTDEISPHAIGQCSVNSLATHTFNPPFLFQTQFYLTMGVGGSILQILSFGSCPLEIVVSAPLDIFRGLAGNADKWVVGAALAEGKVGDMPWHLHGLFIFDYQVRLAPCPCVRSSIAAVARIYFCQAGLNSAPATLPPLHTSPSPYGFSTRQRSCFFCCRHLS